MTGLIDTEGLMIVDKLMGRDVYNLTKVALVHTFKMIITKYHIGVNSVCM